MTVSVYGSSAVDETAGFFVAQAWRRPGSVDHRDAGGRDIPGWKAEAEFSKPVAALGLLRRNSFSFPSKA